MGRVKGTMMLGLVRAIRGDKTRSWDGSLSEEDREVVARQILPSSWYPFDVYRRVFDVVMQAFANNDPEAIRRIGRGYGREIVGSVYKNLVIPGNPMESLKKNKIVFKMLFDFGDVAFEATSDRSGRLEISGFDSSFEGFYYIFAGWNEECLELSGARGVSSTFLARSWKGDPKTVIEFSWVS